MTIRASVAIRPDIAASEGFFLIVKGGAVKGFADSAVTVWAVRQSVFVWLYVPIRFKFEAGLSVVAAFLNAFEKMIKTQPLKELSFIMSGFS